MIKSFKDHIESNLYFVYCFLDPRKPGKYKYDNISFDFEPIYVGKGKDLRPNRHYSLYKKYNTRFYNKIKSIIDDGLKSEFILIQDNLSEKEAFEMEKHFIKTIGRIENGGTLTNLSDGGEGQSGFKFSEESKKQMSIKRLGVKIGPMSDETKINISLSKIGKPSGFKGKTHKQESKDKLSSLAKERTGDRNGMFGKKHKEESKISDQWELTDIDGNKITITNLNKFCYDNNLNANCMKSISYGLRKRHKNWIGVKKITKKKTPVK